MSRWLDRSRLAAIGNGNTIVFLTDRHIRAMGRSDRRKSRKERRPVARSQPHRVATSAVGPHRHAETVPTEPTPAGGSNHRKTQVVALAAVLGAGLLLMLVCTALSMTYDWVTGGPRQAPITAGEIFVNALERGDSAQIQSLWRIGPMPSYDLTGCLNVPRRVASGNLGRRRTDGRIVTRVIYESDCVVGPNRELHDRVYVASFSESGLVYYLGHTRP